MFRMATAAVLALCAAAPLQAAVMIGVTNTGESASSQPPDETDGTLSFQLYTLTPPPLAATDVPSQVAITEYDNISGQAFDDGFVNADLEYDLTVTIDDPVLGAEGTVNILGGGFGGYSPFDASNPFIDDRLFVVEVNGVAIAASDPSTQSHEFSLMASAGGFLNFRLFDPNPDFDRSNPRPGLAFDISHTDTALYQVIPAATSAVPEPASAVLVLWSAGLSAVWLRRRWIGRREKARSAG